MINFKLLTSVLFHCLRFNISKLSDVYMGFTSSARKYREPVPIPKVSFCKECKISLKENLAEFGKLHKKVSKF